MKTNPLKPVPAPHRFGSAGGTLARRLLVAAALILPAALPSTRAAVVEVWVARYNNVVSNANGVSSYIVRDPMGDIIVAGYAGDGIGGQDMLTIKYSSVDGSVLWQRRYNGPANGNDVVQALGVDSSGNVVVAGTSFAGMDPNGYLIFLYDYYIAKYAAADGTLLWERRYHDLDSIYDTGVITLLVDGSDNVVIAGSRYTAKFAAADGARLWLQAYPGVTVAAALDRGGNVVVAGSSFISGTYEDIYTVKYAAADGALLWEQRYNSPLLQYSVDTPTALAVDGRGDVVVSGYCGFGGYYGDFYMAKYASVNGALLWEQLGGFGNCRPTALGVDSRGNVVVAGYTTTGFVAWGWPVYTEYYTARFAAATGALLWAKPSPGWVQEVAFDGNDNVTTWNDNRATQYAAADGSLLSEDQLAFGLGAASVSDGSGNVVVTGGRFETAKYVVATGAELWRQQFKGPANLADIAQAVVVDRSGNVIVTGSTSSETSMDYYTAKYAAVTGALLWEQRYNGPGNYDDGPSALALDGEGNVIVTGSSYGLTDGRLHLDYYTAKYAVGDGALLWEKRYEDPIHYGANPVGVAVDATGNVAVTGSSWDSRERRVQYTAKYARTDGALLWEQNYYNPETGQYQPNALTMDRDGNVVVTGWGITVKYAAADGSLLWRRTSTANLMAIAVDGSGNVAVTGFYSTALNIGDYYTAKYAAADGALLWEKLYHGPRDYSQNQAKSVAVDGSGNVVVTGYSPNASDDGIVCYTAKYAAADGALLWEMRSPIEVSAVAVDGQGDVILTGTAGLTDNTFDYYVAKHATVTGALLWEKRYNGPNNGYDFTRVPQPLALGPNGIIAVTGYSSAFSDPLILFGGTSAYDYATVVYRETHPPVAVVTVSPRFAISPNDTNLFILAPDNAAATVVLDGSHSSDVDNDPLQFAWSADGQTNVLATGPVVIHQFAIGPHTVQLLVSDAYDAATARVTFEVITPATAVGQLIQLVNEASLGSRNKQPLLAILFAAEASLRRHHPQVAVMQLRAFQHLVRYDDARHDPILGAQLIEAAQQVSEALSGGNSHPGGPPHCRVAKLDRRGDGCVVLHLAGEPRQIHIVEASTNLVTWEAIGVATEHGNGTFEFEDANAAKFPKRFYRAVRP